MTKNFTSRLQSERAIPYKLTEMPKDRRVVGSISEQRDQKLPNVRHVNTFVLSFHLPLKLCDSFAEERFLNSQLFQIKVQDQDASQVKQPEEEGGRGRGQGPQEDQAAGERRQVCFPEEG